MKNNRHAALRRLARIEGQVRGIVRMVDEGRECTDILDQTTAVHAALRGVEMLLLRDHAERAADAICRSDDEGRLQRIKELMRVFGKLSR